MDLSKPKTFSYFELVEFFKKDRNNSNSYAKFLDEEKLKTTIEFYEYYKNLFQEYNTAHDTNLSEKLKEAYEFGRKGSFRGKEIYSYNELKTIAKELFFK